MKRLAWPFGAVSLAALAGAMVALGADQPGTTTYRWVDAQGVVHYSDTPQPGAEKLKIPPIQTYSSPAVGASVSRAAPESETSDAYQSCNVVQPAAEQNFYAPEAVTVSVSVQPTLRAGDLVSVTMDGGSLQPLDGSGLRYRISDPDRGAHTLSVTVKDGGGKVLCNSSGVTFYVERPSQLAPQSPTRNHH